MKEQVFTENKNDTLNEIQPTQGTVLQGILLHWKEVLTRLS